MKTGKAYTDNAGIASEEAVKNAGHSVAGRRLIPDDPRLIRKAVRDFLSSDHDVLLTSGGTGVSKDDVTIETVRPFFEKELEGFGEALRRVSWDEIGAASIMTRATAGVARGKVIVCMPGSPEAVKKALEIFIGELPHALFVARS
jgi:molybdenum cofactor biosynthesis protein B